MTIGALLIGLAAAILAVSYLVRPFQREHSAHLEQTIDRWVAQARDEQSGAAEEAPVNYCPHCGRRVAPDHRFCPGCGEKLQ